MLEKCASFRFASGALRLGCLSLFLNLLPLAHAAPAPGLTIVIKPLTTNGKVDALEVNQTLTDGLPAGETRLRFRAPLAVFGVKSVADRITDLVVTDAAGVVPLTVENDPKAAGSEVAYRHWQAARKTTAPVSVHYRIAAQSPLEGGGPPYGMKPAGQGVAGSARGFLLLPENTTTDATRVRWDLSRLPAGSTGVITAGVGDVTVVGPPSEVATQWMLAGPARVFESTRSPGFQVVMIGKQPFDDVKTTVFHEMAHQWVGDLSGAGMWFVEGLTVYLTAVLPCEAGLEKMAFCAHGVNNYAPYYYGAAARNWSLERIRNTVGNENTRRVPYGRGMVYFALVNAQLLERSQGARGLLDVLEPMFVDRTKGVRLDEAAWEKMLLRELGQPAVDEFRASVIEGTKTIVPPSGAFGPGLERVKVRMRVPDSDVTVDGYEWHPVGTAPGGAVSRSR